MAASGQFPLFATGCVIFPGIVVALAALLALSMQALARQPFDAKAFAQAQAEGKTVLVRVHASS